MLEEKLLQAIIDNNELDACLYMTQVENLDHNLRFKEIGYTPLRCAIMRENGTIALALINQGSNPADPVHGGLLFPACLTHDMVLVDKLLERGVDINSEDRMGYTILHRAVHYNDLSLIQYALSRGIDIDIKCRAKETALMHAIKNHSLDVAELLLKAGADTSVVNYKGCNDIDIAELLEKKDSYLAIRQKYVK